MERMETSKRGYLMRGGLNMKPLFLAALVLALAGCVTDTYDPKEAQAERMQGEWYSSDSKSAITISAEGWTGKFFVKSSGKSDIGLSAAFKLVGTVDSVYSSLVTTRVCTSPPAAITCHDSDIAKPAATLNITQAITIMDDGSDGLDRKLSDLFSLSTFDRTPRDPGYEGDKTPKYQITCVLSSDSSMNAQGVGTLRRNQ